MFSLSPSFVKKEDTQAYFILGPARLSTSSIKQSGVLLFFSGACGGCVSQHAIRYLLFHLPWYPFVRLLYVGEPAQKKDVAIVTISHAASPVVAL